MKLKNYSKALIALCLGVCMIFGGVIAENVKSSSSKAKAVAYIDGGVHENSVYLFNNI